jgi:4-hydroxy-tetrahydrodipicolinate synthase
VLTLPLMSIGGVGVVSVAAHLVAGRIGEMIAAYESGDVFTATRLHLGLLPVYTGLFRTQGLMTTKAALSQLGVIGGAVRPPLVDLTQEEFATLTLDLADGGVEGFTA